jgi:DNA-binding MarR family transcriptional regulator
MRDWAFITNHGLVLLFIAQCVQCTTREIAEYLGITERTVHRTLVDLETEGYITRQRTGKGNIYQIEKDQQLRNGLVSEATVVDLLKLLNKKKNRLK